MPCPSDSPVIHAAGEQELGPFIRASPSAMVRIHGKGSDTLAGIKMTATVWQLFLSCWTEYIPCLHVKEEYLENETTLLCGLMRMAKRIMFARVRQLPTSLMERPFLFAFLDFAFCAAQGFINYTGRAN